MKKGLVYGALCALTLAVPAAAEKIYVPVLGSTKLWVASADGVERAVPTGRVGLATVDADAVENVRALLDDRLEVPAFTENEVYRAGLDVPLGDLPHPRAIKGLTVGAANLAEQTASCVATFSRPDGSRLGEVQFDVAPMSLARRDALAAVGNARVGGVTVSCDQNFYPLAIASSTAGKAPIIAKGIGPNGACQVPLFVQKQTNNHWIGSVAGLFHEATKASPKGIVCLKATEDLRVAKAVYEWDVYVGPWSSRNKSGIHNLGYFFLDRYRSGVVGNVNVLGPNKDQLKVMQNVGMPRGTNTNGKAAYAMVTGQTYHVIYTYDATNKKATLQVQLNGNTVSSFSVNAQPGNNQTLILRRFGTGINTGLIQSLEFGNYLGQHPPEEATIGWKYYNFKIDLTPK
jgi:hypothetical protein